MLQKDVDDVTVPPERSLVKRSTMVWARMHIRDGILFQQLAADEEMTMVRSNGESIVPCELA